MSPTVRSRSFIGRSRDLETLAGLLERERLVTLLGPPGMGKTRLAERHLEIERARAEGAATVFCDLTEATGVDDICRVVFQGGFGMSAAQAVIDLSPYPSALAHVDVLESLRNKSLLVRHDLPEEPELARFRLYLGIHRPALRTHHRERRRSHDRIY